MLKVSTFIIFLKNIYNDIIRVADEYSQNNYSHLETRNGDTTHGEYFVNLPDGRLQRVVYTVAGDGDAGYVAEVTYEGEPQYPPPQFVGYGQ